MSNKSLQTCFCGWSKMTTYQGLRTHQGKMGCTPKGVTIPESEQFHYFPKIAILPPPTQLDPFIDIFKTALNSESQHLLLKSHWGEYDEKNIKEEKPSSKRLTQIDPATQQASGLEIFKPLDQTNQQTLQIDPNLDKNQSAPGSIFGAQPHVLEPESDQEPEENEDDEPAKTRFTQFVNQTSTTLFSSSATNGKLDMRPPSKIFATQMNPSTVQTSGVKVEQQALQTDANLSKTSKTPDFSFHKQQVDFMPQAQIFATMISPTTQTLFEDSNRTFFQTPPLSHQSSSGSETARRTLDFSTPPLNVEQPWFMPTTTVQETVIQQNQREKEAERLLKVIQDRMRADLQLKVQLTEEKMAEVSSSVKTCQDSLDAEWMEINNVFSEVIRAVEDARQKALDPVGKRRLKVERDAQDLLHKLQKETDRLKDSLDELDRNPDMQVSLLSGLDKSTDLKRFNIDTSFSFGTLRATTATMMKEIQQKLENLTSLELKRIPVFAEDVKLDSATAHQCLILSDDRKKVRDGGLAPKLPDHPERFDMFGSVLGINIITSGKSYWEVEVGNKTGWDLGVARRIANRKGILAVNSDDGYWVMVHFEDKKYAALTVPPVSLPLRQKPQKVGVFVDYEGGLVSFYNVTNRSHIFSFTECSFRDEIVPYFSPHLKLNDKNTDPLVISAVQKQ